MALIAGGVERSTRLFAQKAGESKAGDAKDDAKREAKPAPPMKPADTFLEGVAAVSVGSVHRMALMQNGSVVAWGFNSYGQLGDDGDKSSDAPVQVKGLSDIASIAAGETHSLALKKDGTVWAWGSNGKGELGFKTEKPQAHAPAQVPGLKDVAAVAAGEFFSLALKKDGSVWGWGLLRAQPKQDEAKLHEPRKIAGLSDIIAIAACDHSLALKKDGTVWAWGSNNDDGQLGDGTTESRQGPVQVKGLKDVVAIAVGGTSAQMAAHSLAVKKNGTVWA